MINITSLTCSLEIYDIQRKYSTFVLHSRSLTASLSASTGYSFTLVFCFSRFSLFTCSTVTFILASKEITKRIREKRENKTIERLSRFSLLRMLSARGVRFLKGDAFSKSHLRSLMDQIHYYNN